MISSCSVYRVAAGGVKSGFGEQQTRSFAPVENSLYASNLDTILWRATAGQSESEEPVIRTKLSGKIAKRSRCPKPNDSHRYTR